MSKYTIEQFSQITGLNKILLGLGRIDTVSLNQSGQKQILDIILMKC